MKRHHLLLCLLLIVPTLRAQTNPVPFVNQPLIPDTIRPGGPAFKLTVTGTGFAPGAVVNWNGSPRVTALVSSSKLVASITSADRAAAGTATITVTNPAPGGGTSRGVFFPLDCCNTGNSVAFARTDYAFSFIATRAIFSADFNGDGKTDLAVSDSTSLDILLGNGDGTFATPLVSPNGGGNMEIGDFNNDGKTDLVVNSYVQGSLVLLGNGDGTFQPAKIFSGVCDGSPWTAAGDFDGDGNLDIALICNYLDIGSVSIYKGRGDGMLYFTNTYRAGTQTGRPDLGDFNGDGTLDIAIPDYSGSVWVLLGNGDATFQPAVGYYGNGISLVAADMNGDDYLDLVTDSVSVLLGAGDGTFQYGGGFVVGSQPRTIAIGDFNGSQKLDAVVANQGSNSVSLLIGDGDASFTILPPYVESSTPNSLAVGDFNGDGRLDLAVTNGASVSVFLQTRASLSPSNLIFADQSVGTTSPSQTVTFTNLGITPLTVQSITVAGTNAGDYSQTNDCGAKLLHSCSINVSFAPTGLGTRSAALEIAYGSTGSPQSVALSGNGVSLSVKLTPNKLDFGTALVRTQTKPQMATLTNISNAAVVINSIVATEDFLQANTCGSSLAIGASCTISVTFRPRNEGARRGRLSVSDNASGSPQTVALSGNGTIVRLSAQSLNFGNQAVGTTSVPVPIKLTNTGPAGLNVSQITITGPNPTDFAQTNNCIGSIPSGGTCTINVTFTPSATGARSATLDISDDGGASPQTVDLSGNGT